jgi:hypothetical protein
MMLSLALIALVTLGIDQLLYDDLSVWIVGLSLLMVRFGFIIGRSSVGGYDAN